jgi:hypothetical protein
MNKKGVSHVIIIVIGFLLVLVVLGIVWLFVKSLLEKGGEQIDFREKCLGINIKIKNIVVNGVSDYNVSIERSIGSNAMGEEISGIKLVFFNETMNNSLDFGVLKVLEKKTKNLNAEIINASKVEASVYFVGDKGNEMVCFRSDVFEF